MLRSVLECNNSFELFTPLHFSSSKTIPACDSCFRSIFFCNPSVSGAYYTDGVLCRTVNGTVSKVGAAGEAEGTLRFVLFPSACLAKWQPWLKLTLRRQNLSGQPCGSELAKHSLPSSWHLHLNSLSKRRVTCLSLSLTHFLPPSLYLSLHSLGSAVCLSLTVGWVEAYVWHASISRKTVQLPQLTMFKPCQLLIHLPSKLCIHRAGLLRVMIFPFWHRAVLRPVRLQSEGRFIQMPVLAGVPIDPSLVSHFGVSCAHLVWCLHNGSFLKSLAQSLPSSNWHTISLYVLGTSLLIPLSPSNLGCLRPMRLPRIFTRHDLSPFILPSTPSASWPLFSVWDVTPSLAWVLSLYHLNPRLH